MDRYHSGHSGSIAVSTGSAQGYGRGGDISLEGGTSRVRLGRRCWNKFLCTYIDTLIPFICIKQHDDGGDVKIKAGTGKNIGLSLQLFCLLFALKLILVISIESPWPYILWRQSRFALWFGWRD